MIFEKISIMTPKKLHYLSEWILFTFICIHLINHFISIFGIEKHIELMNTLRYIYRNVFAESILLSSVCIQLFSWIRKFTIYKKKETTRIEKLNYFAGLYLAVFLVFHISAVFIGRYFLNLNTNFYFGAAGLNAFPANLFFIPYYSLAIISVVIKLSLIFTKIIHKKASGTSTNIQTVGIIIASITVALLIMFGLTSGFTGVKIPEEYLILTGH